MRDIDDINAVRLQSKHAARTQKAKYTDGGAEHTVVFILDDLQQTLNQFHETLEDAIHWITDTMGRTRSEPRRQWGKPKPAYYHDIDEFCESIDKQRRSLERYFQIIRACQTDLDSTAVARLEYRLRFALRSYWSVYWGLTVQMRVTETLDYLERGVSHRVYPSLTQAIPTATGLTEMLLGEAMQNYYHNTQLPDGNASYAAISRELERQDIQSLINYHALAPNAPPKLPKDFSLEPSTPLHKLADYQTVIKHGAARTGTLPRTEVLEACRLCEHAAMLCIALIPVLRLEQFELDDRRDTLSDSISAVLSSASDISI